MNNSTGGDSNTFSSQMGEYLKGIHFPVKKQQIMDMAKGNNAPDAMVSMIDKLPDREYGNMDDLKSAYEEIKKAL